MSTAYSNQNDLRNMSSTELEHETARERERIAHTMAALQDKLSVRHMVDEALHQGATYGADVSRNFGRALRDNPVPAALIGVGILWLMARGTSATNHYRSRYYSDADHGTYGFDDGYDEPYHADHDESLERVSAMNEVRDGVAGRMEPRPRSLSAAATNGGGTRTTDDMKDEASHLGNKARHQAERVREEARYRSEEARYRASRYAHDVGERASHVYDEGRRRVEHAYSSAQDMAYDTYEEARRRARRAARATRRAGRDAGEAVSDFVHDQPLVAGGIALALGAAIGGLLPRTRLEDDYIGSTSDYVKERAREEAHRAQRVAEAAYDEVRDAATDLVDEVRERVPSREELVEGAKARLGEASDRVEAAAEGEAERQNLADKPAKGRKS